MADQTTLRATFVSESAAYRNTFGWYNSVTGVGGILFGSIEAEGSQRTVVAGQSYVDFKVNTADVGNIQYFLIADGGNLNADQPDDLTGNIKVIKLADGTWAVADADANGNVIYKNGKPDLLVGAGVNAMFTETSKNAGAVDYASSYVGTQQTAARLAGDTADGATGLIAWEDLAATKKNNGTYTAPGDADYNDAVFQISVVNSNRPPVANADTASVSEDAGATTINVLANDTDPDAGSTLRVTAVSTSGVLGTVTIAANGQGVIYTPAASFQSLAAGQTATETFTYTVSDQSGASATATTTVTIIGANDAPVVSGAVTGTATEDGVVSTLNALAKASDVDNGTILSVVNVPVSLPAGVTYNASAKTFSLNPMASAYQSLAAGATTTVTVNYGVSDGTVTTGATASWTITGTNDAPVVAGAVTGTATEDGAVSALNALANASDIDSGTTLSVVNVPASLPAGVTYNATTKTFSLDPSASAYQSLKAGATTTVTVSYGVSDGFVTTAATASWSITGANDAPVVTGAVTGTATEDGAISTLNALARASDVDTGATLSIVNVPTSLPAGVTYDAVNKTFSLNPSASAYQSLKAGTTTTVTVSYGVTDGTATTPASVSWTVTGTNDSPVVSGAVTGTAIEDGAVATLNALANASDIDSGTTLSVVNLPASLPAGVTYNASTKTFSLDPSASAYQSLKAGATTTVTVSYGVSDGTATVPATASWVVTGTNDGAVIGAASVHDVTEDASAVTLTASGSVGITDADQGEAAFQAGSVSAVGNLGSLSFASDGSYTYSVANSLTQSLGPDAIKTDTFTITSIDGTTKQITFDIHGVQDKPVLTLSPTSGNADQSIPLSISVALIDAGAAKGPIEIKGIPSQLYTLNHGIQVNDGDSWILSEGDLTGLALVPKGQIPAADFTLIVTASSISGASSATSTGNISVHVEPGAVPQTTGKLVDGYIAGATVFADANDNGVLDTGEAFTTTAADGSFTLVGGSGSLVSIGGTDVSTGVQFQGSLKAPAGSTVITPLTTLIVEIVAAAPQGQPITAAEAANQIAAAFGFDNTAIDLTTFDPVPTAVTGDATATAILSAAIQVQSTVAQIAAVGGSSSAVFSSIANAVTAAAAEPTPTTVDLSAPTTVSDIVSGAGVSGTAATVVASTVAAANGSIQGAANVTELAQAGQVAQGAASAQLAELATAIANNQDTTTLTNQINADYVTNIATTVQAAEVGDVDGAQLGTLGNDTLTGAGGNDSIDGLDGNDTINGAGGNDLLFGGAGKDLLTGGAGNDRIDGGTNFDRSVYTDATGGITVDMLHGTVTGAGIGTDTLVDIEGVIGSEFADTYDGSNFTGASGVVGTPTGFNEFEGRGGNDTIITTVNSQGAALTRVSYLSATSGVTVDLQSGFANGDVSVGHDTIMGSGVLSVWGSSSNDSLSGSNNGFGSVEVFEGRGGNDTIDGRGGFDRVDYNNDSAVTTGISVQLAAGTVTGDSTIGTDTLISVEAVRGTNFADTYNAAGFNGTSANAGSFTTFNEFTGNGGNDTIIGNGNTRLGFNNATAAITVNLQTGGVAGTGVADGDASVGHDTFSGVNAVQASFFDDTLLGSSNNEQFIGLAGNDFIDGKGGFDTAQYHNIYYVTGGVTVNLAAGTAVGDASIGNDTLRSVEGIQGTSFADTFTAVGFTATSTNAGSAGVNGSGAAFNQFEGLGGNDSVTGNGNTRLLFTNATAGVNVNIATGIASGDASVGTDTFSGVNAVTGSAWDDTITGDGGFNFIDGGAGNDAISGGAGGDAMTGGVGNDSIDGGTGADIAVFSGARNQYTINGNTPSAGQTQVVDGTAGRDGTDTLTNVEIVQFNNAYVMIASGSAGNAINVNGLGFNGNTNTLFGTGSSDFLTIGQNLFGHQIDLGGGTDTLGLAVSGGYTLNLAGVENLTGTTGDDFVTLTNQANGMSVSLGAGTNDSLNLALGTNTLSLTGVENVLSTDFASGQNSNDILFLTNQVSNLSVNLANGTNTLNLAAGTNQLNNIGNVATINGTASDDALTISNGVFGTTVNLGDGINDALILGNPGGFNNVGLIGVENVIGGAANDFLTVTNTVSSVTFNLGDGNDTVQLASGNNSIGVLNVETIQSSDFGGTNPFNDALQLLTNVNGISINLGDGTNNTLFLAQGANTLANAFNVNTINGTTGTDQLTLQSNYSGTIDLGGGQDTLNISSGFGNVTAVNVETVNGSNSFDNIILVGAAGTTVTGGLGADSITMSAGADRVRFASVADSGSSGDHDTLINFNAAMDRLVIDGPFNGAVSYIGNAAFDGSSPNQARIDNFAGQTFLQVDVNRDGMFGAGDMQIAFTNLTGTLSAANFEVANQRPTDILLSSSAVAENSPANTAVGLLSSIDPDAGDSASFQLLDNAGGKFALNGNSLVVAGTLDFEATASHQITVRVTDSANNTYDKTFTIGVTNVNETPTNITLSGTTVAENSANNTVIGSLAAIDPDLADSASFELLDDAGGRFALSGSNLVVAGGLNYEASASHQVTVRVKDSANNVLDKTFTIGVTNVNEAPTNILLSNATVAENGTLVGALSAADPDTADSFTFSLVDNAGGKFAISGNNLVVAGGLDFEATTSHQVTVRVTDAGGLFFDKQFAIGVTNVNEAPTSVSLSANTVPQSSATGTVVGSLSSIDPDAGDTVTYTLLNNAGGQFSISGGNIVVASALTAAPQDVVVRATDAGGLTFDKTLTINVVAGATVLGDANPNALNGTAGDDTIRGFAGNDILQGLAGNDLLDGGDGFDRAVFTDATTGVTITLASGSVTAAGIGTDTLVGIEGAIGTNNDDTFDARGFAGVTNLAGTPTGFNDFEGKGGNDTIYALVNGQGATLTRVSYLSATAGVTANLATGLATGDGSVGTDTFIGQVGTLVGSAFADTFTGSNNGAGTVEVFDGRGGNDTFNGGGGFDRADYNNDPAVTAGITVNLAAGTVTSTDTVNIGSDTLRSIEAIRGTKFDDTYNAAGFTTTATGPAPNAGSSGANGTGAAFNEFTGGGGIDTIIGNGNTRLNYNNATAGVSVNLQTGATAGTGTATGDGSVDTDNFSGVNAVMSSFFNDTLNGSSANDTFTPLAGDDFIDGKGGFDTISYNNIYFVTSGVNVNFTTGTVTAVVNGDTSIGTDTLRNIESLQGTHLADTFVATGFGAVGLNPATNNVSTSNGNFNQFEGLGGNDSIIGNGNTRLHYGSAAAGITVNLQAGTVVGSDASVGTDTFVGVNSVNGSNSVDTYDATGFTGTTSAGSFGTFNLFEGLGGNDIIIGNGNTRVSYSQSGSGVTVNLATGAVTGGAGADVITVGTVNGIQGSNFVDTLTGDDNNNFIDGGSGDDTLNGAGGADNLLGGIGIDTLNGGDGNDTMNGGAGNDIINGGLGVDVAVYSGPSGNYTFNAAQVVNTGNANGDNTDTLSGVEILQFSNASFLLVSGSAVVPIDVSGVGLGAGTFNGTAADDFITGGINLSGRLIDLGAGTGDTINLIGSPSYNLNLANVENVNGTAADEFLNLTSAANGLVINLGSGTDTLLLNATNNTLSVVDVESVQSTDFGAMVADDTLTFQTNVSGVSLNLGNGNNVVNLTGGVNSLSTVFGTMTVNGSGSSDTLTIGQNFGPMTYDLGGGSDTLNFTSQASSATVVNVENVNGSAGADVITIANTAGSTTVTGGLGNDVLMASAGQDNFRFTSVAESSFTGVQDDITNFNASADSFVFAQIPGFTGSLDYIGVDTAFSGTPGMPHSQARLDTTGYVPTLQIDVDGDGSMGANDMAIHLINLQGTLSQSNFMLIV